MICIHISNYTYKNIVNNASYYTVTLQFFYLYLYVFLFCIDNTT